jgi:hypothetical protein
MTTITTQRAAKRRAALDIRHLTVERVMRVGLFVMIFALATRIPVDTDTWWHVRSGEYTLANGFIYEDPFSYTRSDTVWINHSWGAQLLIYGVYSLAGNAGLALYTAAFATGGMVFVYLAGSGNTYLRAFIVILGASTAAVFWSPRPQMVSFFLSTVILYLLFQYKFRDVDRLWLIPLLMALWGNLHAGYSIGFIFMAGVIGGEIAACVLNPGGDEVKGWRGVGRLILVGLASALLIMVNPYTYRMLLLPFQTVGLDVLRNFIQEWQSPNFQNANLLPFILMLVGLFGALGASPRRVRWASLALLSGTLYLALAYGRNVAVFAVVAAPLLMFHTDALLKERGWDFQPRRRVRRSAGLVNAGLLLLLVIAAVGKIAHTLEPERVREAQEDFLPVRVSAYLQANPVPGGVFNSYDWGGYLMWALPEMPVYVDGRTDLYGDEFLSEYIDVYTLNADWRDVFAQRGVNSVVIESGSPIGRELATVRGWSEVYRDEQAVVFVRDEVAP